MCEKEVLVDIVREVNRASAYGKVTPDFIPKLITEHVVNGISWTNALSEITSSRIETAGGN